MSIARGVTAVFPPPEGRELVEVVHQAPEVFGIERSRWRLRDLRRAVPWLRGYTLAGISRALGRLGVRRKRGRLSVHSPDPAYQKKLSWIEGARAFSEREPERASLVYGDEFTLFRQPSLAPVYAAQGVEPKALLSHKSNTRYRVSAALDAVTGRLTWTAGSKMGVKGLRRFLGELRKAYPERRLFWCGTTGRSTNILRC